MSEHEVNTTAHRSSYPMGNKHHGTPERPDWGTFCVECKDSWPCDVSILAARLADAEARAEAAEATVRLVRNEARSLAAAYESHPEAMHTGRTVADDLDHVAAIEALRGDQ